MGQWKTKFLVKHLRRNDKTGKLFRISLEFTQMELGTKEPFYNLNFYGCKKIVTPTWLTHLWQYWTDANIKPEISNMWTYHVERTNDVFLMDLLRSRVKDDNALVQLNLCRMQLGVITLSGIVSLSGDKLLPNIHEGKNMRKSKFLWPKQKVPVSWWTQWSNYITSIIEPYLQCHKLGKCINQSHQYWKWKMDDSRTCVTNGLSFFRLLERCNNRTLRAQHFEETKTLRRHGTIPVDVYFHNKKLTVVSTHSPKINSFVEPVFDLIPIQVLHRCKIPSSIIRKKVKTVVDPYPFLRQNEYTSEKKLRKLKRACKKNAIILATDGSARGNRSSFGYCISRCDRKILFKSHSPVIADYDYHFSDRAELLAILAATSHIKMIFDTIPLTTNKMRSYSFPLYTDSASSITRIEDKASNSTKTVLKSNLDILFEIQAVCKNMKPKIKLHHVDSHQDDEIPFIDLPLPLQLNCVADTLAEKEYCCPPPSLAAEMPHLQASIITFKNNDFRLTSNIPDELIKLRCDYDGERAALKSWNVNLKQATKIDWKAIDVTMKKWDAVQYGGAVKCVHRLWDTSGRKQDWGQASNGICSLCETCKETCDHVLRCRATKKVRKIFFNELNSGMKKIQTFPSLRRWVMIMVQQWAGGYDVSLPPKGNHALKGIRRALRSQCKLGIANFFRGILSIKWNELQLEYEKNKASHGATGAYRLHNWSATVSKLCIECSVKIWRYRSEMIHVIKEGNVDDILRSKLLTYSLSLQDTPWLLRSRDRHLIKRNVRFFQKSKRVTLLSWKNRLDVALKLAEQSVSEVGNDLNYFFCQTQIREVSRGVLNTATLLP